MNNGVQTEKWVAGMLREMYRQRYGDAKVQELYNSGKHWALTTGEAIACYKRNEFERCLKLARLVLPKCVDRDGRETCQAYIVRALWKLKQYDEAKKEAQDGQWRFPEKPTFHYLYAVVANEAGDVEAAFKSAHRAVEINPGGTGYERSV